MPEGRIIDSLVMQSIPAYTDEIAKDWGISSQGMIELRKNGYIDGNGVIRTMVDDPEMGIRNDDVWNQMANF